MNMKTGYIYKITNRKNGKIYIGKTIQTIERRFKDHIKAFKFKTKNYVSYLYRAFEKYGIENFSIEVVEEVIFESESELDSKERYYIKTLNTQDKNIGYNIQEGEEGGAIRSKEFKPTEKQLKALEKYSHLPASEKLKQKLSEIRTNCIVSKETGGKLRQAQLGKIAVNNGFITKYIRKEEKDLYLSKGWKLGRIRHKK